MVYPAVAAGGSAVQLGWDVTSGPLPGIAGEEGGARCATLECWQKSMGPLSCEQSGAHTSVKAIS